MGTPCAVPTIEVQNSMATKDGSVSESPFPTVKVSVQSNLQLDHKARKSTTQFKQWKEEEEKKQPKMLSEF